MRSTRPAALSAAMKSILIAAVAVAIGLSLAAAPASAQSHKSPCADRLCKRDVPNTPKCTKLHGHKKVARCFIARAARHYGQSKRQAYYIAWRESRYNWRVTNPSSGTAGLYQFARTTWNHTPYRRYSPYNPRMASLAAMWMWKHGGQYHWRA
jgi:hypothetical protein